MRLRPPPPPPPPAQAPPGGALVHASAAARWAGETGSARPACRLWECKGKNPQPAAVFDLTARAFCDDRPPPPPSSDPARARVGMRAPSEESEPAAGRVARPDRAPSGRDVPRAPRRFASFS